MQKILVLLFLFIGSINIGFSQAVESKLNAPENWRSELIEFPLGFAPEIDLVGFEDVRFAPGWADPQSEEFWTYHFTWFIEHKELTEENIAHFFNLYYDGLTAVILKSKDSEIEVDKTLSLFIKTDKGFTGKVRTFDSFFTQEYLTLSIKVREFDCNQSTQQVVSFDIAPKPFTDEVWQIFDAIEIIDGCVK